MDGSILLKCASFSLLHKVLTFLKSLNCNWPFWIDEQIQGSRPRGNQRKIYAFTQIKIVHAAGYAERVHTNTRKEIERESAKNVQFKVYKSHLKQDGKRRESARNDEAKWKIIE